MTETDTVIEVVTVLVVVAVIVTVIVGSIMRLWNRVADHCNDLFS